MFSARRALSLALGLLALAPVSSASAASAPAGFFALGDRAWPSTSILDREQGKGLASWRIALDYGAIGATQGKLDFSGVDGLVGSMARRGVRPFFVLTGCPAWSCAAGAPPTSGQQLTDWKAFVTASVRRYGAAGTYWSANTSVPKLPVNAWQVFNEVNGAGAWPNPSAAAYAPFLAATNTTIKAVDPAAKTVLSGLPEKMTIWLKDYLPALYAQPGFKTSFDVLAIHGYTALPADVAKILDLTKTIATQNGDASRPIWITELGWSTGGPAHPFTVTEATQAANLQAAGDVLIACAARWNLQRAYWFGYRDATPSGTDYWGFHTGLTRTDGNAKPALAAFDEYTSGAALAGARAASCPLPGGTTIDSTAPNTSIASGPGVRTADTRPAYRFAATEAGVRYECHYLGSPWAACAPDASGTWRPAAALPQGSQTLEVRAIDPSGNVDATPAASTTIIDLTPPDTYIAGTFGNVKALLNTLTLSANEPVTKYECKIDAGAWAACSTTYSFTLPLGAHTVSVRSYDLAGNVDPNPAQPWYQVAG